MRILFALLVFSNLAMAEYPNGNVYFPQPSAPGMPTTVQGMNLNTGSNWNTTYQPNGNQNGVNASGQSWNYNQSAGTYMNFNTGKTCVNGYCN